MMRLLQTGFRVLLLILGCVSSVAAGDASMTLLHNPFAKPAILAAPPARSAKQEALVEQAIELQLTATLVSDTAPLVIVEGEMLGIGEEIEGYRLLSVEEGSAVFDKKDTRHTFVLVGSGVDVE